MRHFGKILLGLIAGFLLGLLPTWGYTSLWGPLDFWGKIMAGYISLSLPPTVDYYVHRGNDYWLVMPMSVGMLLGAGLAHMTSTIPTPS